MNTGNDKFEIHPNPSLGRRRAITSAGLGLLAGLSANVQAQTGNAAGSVHKPLRGKSVIVTGVSVPIYVPCFMFSSKVPPVLQTTVG